MVRLYTEGADYLLGKNQFYPAFVLMKKAVEKEPWNKTTIARFEEIVEAGYDYYNHQGEDDLFRFFKAERAALKKSTRKKNLPDGESR